MSGQYDGMIMSGYSSENEDDCESIGPAALEFNYDELKRCASIVLCRDCVRVEKMSKGSSNEILTLFFKPEAPDELEWSCIARATRDKENFNIDKWTSELETMLYIKEKTSIPVPEVYFSDLDQGNTVGAPFVLMERMPGRDLYHYWDNLGIEHKKDVVTQLVDVLKQLASLEFTEIGSLQEDGRLAGPIIDGDHGSENPFESTFEYLSTSLKSMSDSPFTLSFICRKLLSQYLTYRKYMKAYPDDTCFEAPYCLMHPDFNGQNMIFTMNSDGSLQLSGIIDWEYATTGSLFYLYEYPPFLIDHMSDERKNYAAKEHPENLLLRKHFTSELQKLFDEGSDDAFKLQMVQEALDQIASL